MDPDRTARLLHAYHWGVGMLISIETHITCDFQGGGGGGGGGSGPPIPPLDLHMSIVF